MSKETLKANLREIPDFPIPGITRKIKNNEITFSGTLTLSQEDSIELVI